VTDLNIKVVEDPRLLIVVSDESGSRELADLSDVQGLVHDRAPVLTNEQARVLGSVTAVLASLDSSVVWQRDVGSLGRLLDAYDFSTGSPETSRSFGEGVADVLRLLQVLDHPPSKDEVAELLGLAI